MKITLQGSPVSTGTLYRYACRGNFPTMYMTAKGRNVKEAYQWEMKSKWKDDIIKEDVEVDIKLYFKDKRKHDIDNYNKILLDAGTGIIWVDDSQITKMTIEKFIDKKNPRIELIIKN